MTSGSAGLLFRCALFAQALMNVVAQASQVIYVSQSASGLTNGQSWSTAYGTVQTALADAAAGDEIWVATGTYFGTIRLKEGVALYGGFAGTETSRTQRDWNVHRTILDGQGSNNVAVVPATSTLATRLDGFTLQNGAADYGAGIYCAGGSPVLANNTIVRNNSPGIVGGSGILADTALDLASQTPLSFFTNVAERLLETKGLRIDSIPLYPSNGYSADIHRLLQVAANLYDATTNRGASYPFYPSVFRPVFTNDAGNIRICGFVEAENADFMTNRWLDLGLDEDRAALSDDSVRFNANVFGQAIVVGGKKGLPNFNEVSLETDVLVARRLQAAKSSPQSPAVTYRQSYELSISNSFGVEAWNSYTQAFPRPLELRVTNHFRASLVSSNQSPPIVLASVDTVQGSSTNLDSTNLWNSMEFRVPLSGQVTLVPDSALFYSPPYLRPLTSSNIYDATPGFAVPQLTILITQSLQYILVDQSSGRVLDLVNLDGLVAGMDVNRFLAGSTNTPDFGSRAGMFWLTNRDTSTPMTWGITNQIYVASQNVLSDAEWNDYMLSPIAGSQKEKAIDGFRKFLGLPPLFDPADTNPPPGLVMQVPFTPARRLSQTLWWQANDPLVHYHIADLFDPVFTDTNNILVLLPRQSPPASNLGFLNHRYRPWGGSPGKDPNASAFDSALKDRLIRQSDDWDFPSETTVNLNWLDRVHRGTPWQTIYFGSSIEPVQNWTRWSGNAATHPTNDWQLIELFLSRGLSLDLASVSGASPLLVNNTIAANSGSTNGTICIAPGSTPALVNNIIAFNSSGVFKQGAETVIARTNCVFANGSFDYSGLSAGAGDLAADPEFVSPASGNFDLLATSPCIDAGDDSVFSAAWLLDEPARRQGAHAEIGAYELSPSSPGVITDLFEDSSGGPVEFKLKGFTGRRFAIETSTNLVGWLPVLTNSTADGFFLFRDAPTSGSNERFYRARLVP
ncbi:MAG: hypothetical protein DME21_02625 [Verrucomicrobia bacterium]|nr:MAG: hypothetical protein DME21_02625 [Verrucomicrobiota bacterium]